MAKNPKNYDDDEDTIIPPPPPKVTTTSTPVVDQQSGLPPEDYHTEQFKHGPDPVDPPVEPVPADIVTVGIQEPYPQGNPPPDPFYNPPEETAP